MTLSDLEVPNDRHLASYHAKRRLSAPTASHSLKLIGKKSRKLESVYYISVADSMGQDPYGNVSNKNIDQTLVLGNIWSTGEYTRYFCSSSACSHIYSTVK